MDIIVMDTNFTKIDTIDVFESFIWIDRYDEAGWFELYTPVTPYLVSLLKEDRYLSIKESSHTMIIETIEIRTDVEKGNKLVVSGRSIESILDRRLIFRIDIDSTLQAAIHSLLTNNVISVAGQPQRNIPGFVLSTSTDPLVTAPTLKAQYNTENLYETIAYLTRGVELGFQIILNDNNQFVFSMYAGKDRSYDQSVNPYVIFSPQFDNLLNSNFLYTKRYKKTIAFITADAYHGDPRPGGDFDPWENDPNDPNYFLIRTGLERRELFIDAPDLSTVDPNTGLPYPSQTFNDMMHERARRELNENVEISQFEGQVDTTNSYKPGIDFFLGDIVQIENEYGFQARSRIKEITYSENLSGIYIYPTFSKL